MWFTSTYVHWFLEAKPNNVTVLITGDTEVPGTYIMYIHMYVPSSVIIVDTVAEGHRLCTALHTACSVSESSLSDIAHATGWPIYQQSVIDKHTCMRANFINSIYRFFKQIILSFKTRK